MEHLEYVATEIDINEVLIFSRLKDLDIEVINFYLRSQSKEFVAVFEFGSQVWVTLVVRNLYSLLHR